MISYIFRRLLFMIPTLLLVSIVVFFLIQLPPGDYVETLITQLQSQGQEVSQSHIQSLKSRYGLNQPKYIQYYKWITGFPSGDFGTSFLFSGRQVWDVIQKYLGFTLLVTFSTQIFILIIGLPLGIYSATHQYSIGDHFFTFIAFIGLSIPNFLFALTLMFVGYFYFGIEAMGGLFSTQYINAPWSWARIIDLLNHLWIPVIVLGTAGTAGIFRIMRGNLLDILNFQYVATARAKGLKESIVIYKHAVRNALNPIIMAIGMRFPLLLSGATIVGIVLSLPTLGPVLFRALTMQDMYLAGTVLFFQSFLLLIGNLFSDILLAWVDPRVKYD